MKSIRALPATKEGAGVLGVVFEEENYYGDLGGPMVRWVTGTACNIYEGDVEVIDTPSAWERRHRLGG